MKSNFTFLLKSSLMVLFLCLGLSVLGQSTTFFQFTGTSNYLPTPAAGWSSVGTNGGDYLRLSPGSVTSPEYLASENIVFKYDIGSFGSGSATSTKLFVLNSSDIVISEFDLTSTTGGGTYTTNQIINVGTVTTNFKIKIEGFGTGTNSQSVRGTRLRNYSLVGEILTSVEPLISVNPTEITSLGYMEGNSSVVDIFSIDAINLDGTDVVVTAPTNFQVSLDDISYSNTLTLTYNDSTLATTDVYVRLNSGLPIGHYTGDIIISGGDAPNKTVSLTAEVIEFSLICGQEGFENATELPTGSNYGEGTFVGNNEITWYYHGQSAGEYSIDGNGFLLRRASDSYLEVVIPDGVGKFSFEYRKAYAGNASRELELIINEEQVAVSPVFGVNPTGADTTTHTFTHIVDVEGTVTVRIKLTGNATTNRHTTIDNISWTCYSAISIPVIWTTDNEWSNVTGPTIDNDVVVEGDLFVGIDLPGFEAKTLTVDTNGSLYIESGNSVTVAGQIINEAGVSNFIVESGANLIQTSDYTGANEGQITVYRDSQPMKRLDYTLWSSPVEGMLLKDFSNVSLTGGNGTIWNRVYTLGATEWEQVWGTQAIFQTDNTTTFTEAKGYLYRSRNDFSSENSTVFEGEFFGVPNNGTKTLITPNTYDAVGNPYPSTINADLFFEENDEATAVYFWTNTNPAVGGTYEGQGTNWASYTLAGGVGTDSADNSSVVPNGLIAAGQGFVVENLGSSVMFNNGMRVGNSGMFFKTMETEKHRLWLNLSVENITLNQMMIAYMDGATQGFDSQIDGKMYGYEGSALYSTITTQQDAYIIQGRSLPFSDTDVVHLGFKATQAGTYTVSLVDFDGLFVEGQEVYLKDNSTGIEYDLKNGDYSFVSQEGIFENRFEVVYKTNADLSVTNPNLDNKWVIYSQGNGFQIETQGFDMKNVTLYDVLGRTVYNNQAEGTNHVMSNIANGVFIVKVITSDNQTLIKKIAK